MTGFISTKSRALAKIFLCFLATGFFAMPASGSAQTADSSFRVDNITVDVSAESSVAAREKAFNAAQVKAYEKLVARKLGPEEKARFNVPPLERISALVQSFEVSNEQVSATRYRGTYEVTFQPHQITAPAAQSAGAPYGTAATGPASNPTPYGSGNVRDTGSAANTNTATPASARASANMDTVLVMPVLEQNGRRIIWANNAFNDAFERTLNSQSMLVIPDGTADDRAAVRDDENINFERARLSRMESKYNAKETYFVLSSLSQNAREPVQLSYYRAGPSGAQQVKQEEVAVYNDDTPESLSTRIATQALVTLESLASVRTRTASAAPVRANDARAESQTTTSGPSYRAPPASGPVQQARVMVDYNSVRDWLGKKRLIESAAGVAGMQVTAMSARQATASLSYRGDIGTLEQSLRRAGFRMSQANTYGGAAYRLERM